MLSLIGERTGEFEIAEGIRGEWRMANGFAKDSRAKK
jgi:hypothetical protein